ncbi:hypothetical protein G7Z17_g6985 [Cylindrodendrum hubeiense]|uniref:Uncharacterized protein n=1 Tax=Cylindrodendrum hubeiense TaxID=595255 RepID=A0A9P5HBB3_9HYPO|nr:hypothetical protein G7Z17_g6985 [Cylindrodendrum hubeiense]
MPLHSTPPASMSRSRASSNDIQSLADQMLRNSISRSSISSTSTKVPSSYSRSNASDESTSNQTGSPTGPNRLSKLRPPPASATSSTSSVARSRLREVEAERDELLRAVEAEQVKVSEMRRKADEERAVAERIKKEGGVSGLSPSDAKRRVRDLKREEIAAGFETPRRSTVGLFKVACSTDLLFLIDTTSSMKKYITAAKDQVKSIMYDIKKTFLNEAEVRIAVVGYKDHANNPNIEFLDFTTSAEQVHSFLDKLTAKGGGDTPEDVLGGIQQAINASWKHQTRCIIHIADAPPHGRTFHDYDEDEDDYYETGSEPHRLTYKPLLSKMIGLSINYIPLNIRSSTDRTVYLFSKEYAAASSDCKLLSSNKYYKEASSELRISNNLRGGGRPRGPTSAKGELLFEELKLGTSYSALRHLVVRSVTSSASRTAVRLSAAASRTSSAGGLMKSPLVTYLAPIKEDEDRVDKICLEEITPQWDTPGWLDERLVVQGFSPEVIVHGANTLNDMMADDKNIKLSITDLTIHKRSKPFAQGEIRLASYARVAVSTNRFVAKSFKKDGKGLAHLAEDMRCQTLCKAFALEFNALVSSKHSIDFIVTTCLKGMSGTSAVEHMSLEPYIHGTYIKYNNNSGYVNQDIPNDEFNKAAQAFSHFTFERSSGEFLVCDLQGVGQVLTDPAIHTLDPNRFKLVDTNLGEDGFKFFFAAHDCNKICEKLELKSNKEMMMSNSFRFRDLWPTLDKTVCCSNKLCGKIVSVSISRKSPELPGYHWCNVCWPQLSASRVDWICIAPGPHHEFNVSRFFYESQGQVMPRKCHKHREKDGTTARTAVVSRSLWTVLKSATRKKS